MAKFILFLIFCFSLNSLNAQVIAVSDTIREMNYYGYNDSLEEYYIRKNSQYSPNEDERNQNFANLRMEKVIVENQTLYVMVFDKISVTHYNLHSYVTLAVEFGRKSASSYQSFNNSFFFAFTEEQYNNLKRNCYENENKIIRIKGDIANIRYCIGNIEHELNTKYNVEHSFVFSSYNDSVKFRLPEQYYIPRFSKKLFRNGHFKCSIKEFEKLLKL